jgi:hypothetical protein
MDLELSDKLVITQMNVRTNVRVVYVRENKDGSKTYMLEPLRQDFAPHKMGGKIMRITSRDIESKEVNIEKHEIKKLY